MKKTINNDQHYVADYRVQNNKPENELSILINIPYFAFVRYGDVLNSFSHVMVYLVGLYNSDLLFHKKLHRLDGRVSSIFSEKRPLSMS